MSGVILTYYRNACCVLLQSLSSLSALGFSPLSFRFSPLSLSASALPNFLGTSASSIPPTPIFVVLLLCLAASYALCGYVFSGRLGVSTILQETTFNFAFSICAPLNPGHCLNNNNQSNSACYLPPAAPGLPAMKDDAGVCVTFPVVLNPAPPGPVFGTNCMGQYTTAGASAFKAAIISANNGGVSLEYPNGDATDLREPFSSTINVFCNKKVTGAPMIAVSWQLGNSHVVFNVQHAAGCPVLVKAPLSGGWICFIILIVGTVVYLVGGVLYNKFVKGRDGIALIPNHTFWQNFPGLLADGVRFAMCRPPAGATYEVVEG